MEKESKKPEFVVTDRRKFNVDGEPRPDAPVDAAPVAGAAEAVPEAKAAEATADAGGSSLGSQAAEVRKAAAAEPVKAEPAKVGPAKMADSVSAPASMSTTAAEIETGYNGEKQRSAFGGQKMEFIHLLDMLVQTAMMYAGAMESGTERRVDVVGLRQMIDLIAVLEEKTKGNLTEQEQAILTNTVFQLRMTYMEIINMIEKSALQKGPGSPGSPLK